MAQYNWSEFLARFNRSILEYVNEESPDDLPDDITPEVIASGWMGFKGASDAQIEAAEARLNIKLPPSYRSFLQTSNGFRMPGNLVPSLLAVDEIVPYPPEAEWGSDPVSDAEYFVYGTQQRSEMFRNEYLKTAVIISETEEAGTAQFLLNPQVVFDDGEYEAWMMAHWLPGANRYRSFWELMQAEYDGYLRLIASHRSVLLPGDPLDAIITKLPGLIARFDESIAQYRELAKADAIHQGTLEGLVYARDQIVSLQGRTRNPQKLRKGLLLLAEGLEERHMSNEADKMRDPYGAFAEILGSGLAGMLEFLRRNQMMEGYRQAAGILRWFLNKDDDSE